MNVKILVVEDNKFLLKTILTFLDSYGYEISTATNGIEGLEKLTKTHFDIVISDIRMPEMDGMQLLAQIKEMSIQTEVVIITAHSEEYSYVEVIDSGAIDFIAKPFTRNEFKAKIQRVVREVQIQNELRRSIELQKKREQEKEKMQTILNQQEKMACVGQLAAGVAHEINNPTGFILSNLKSLKKYFAKIIDYTNDSAACSNPEELQRLRIRKKLKIDYMLEDIPDLIDESIDGGNRIRDIVQNLKCFSRVENCKPEDFHVNDCIENTLKIIWNELKYKVEIVKEYGELPIIKCHPQELSQVFMNLLVNASHAIEKHGNVTIKTWSDDRNIFIAISDTGCGISQENIPKLFEPFFTTKEVGKGTGLGLSISHKIVKKHNGRIDVESEIGKGTTFTVVLPLTTDLPKENEEMTLATDSLNY